MSVKKILQLGSTGRSPWYNADGMISESYVIGVAGGSASGKTSVADRILKSLNVPWVVIISMDSFYRPLTPEQCALAHQSNYDLDHPSAFDFEALYDCLSKLKAGKSINVPVYNFSKHAREDYTTTIYGANVIIFEGIFALYDKKIRDLMDLKIFVDTDADIRLARRLQRDIAERGRSIHGIIEQYNRFVKPSYDEYIQPTVRHADVIIPRGLENAVAIDLLAKHVQRQLQESELHLRWSLGSTHVGETVPANVHVLPSTNQIKGIHTILRDHTTPRDEFVFYADRLSILIMESGLSLIPFEAYTVETPVGVPYEGLRAKDKICGVSILRAGGTMEAGLRRVCSDVLIGKILIQTDPSTGEPQLHYIKLPSDVKNYQVVLMDATVGTGAAGLMAIRVLLDHDVPEENIVFMTFLAASVGLNVIAKAFPRVKLVTSMVDPVLSKETLFIEPGIGNFGDRYFGTEDDA
ncbi:uridine kinase [Spinellus fusiger]|nr:uridine kinase [Spinellus fusiger]